MPFGAAGADRLLVRHRVAGLEHAPVERLETRRELRDHLLQRLADVILDRQRIELGKRVVQADEPSWRSQKPIPTGAETSSVSSSAYDSLTWR